MFNDTKVELATSQKHLGLILYSRIGFNEHIDNKINKCNRLIGIMKILPLTLSGKSLLKTYKSFVRSNRDQANIIQDKPFIESFKRRIKSYSQNFQQIGDGPARPFFFHKIAQELLPSILKLTVMLLVKEQVSLFYIQSPETQQTYQNTLIYWQNVSTPYSSYITFLMGTMLLDGLFSITTNAIPIYMNISYFECSKQ